VGDGGGEAATEGALEDFPDAADEHGVMEAGDAVAVAVDETAMPTPAGIGAWEGSDAAGPSRSNVSSGGGDGWPPSGGDNVDEDSPTVAAHISRPTSMTPMHVGPAAGVVVGAVVESIA
jgi:hypothetical protein